MIFLWSSPSQYCCVSLSKTNLSLPPCLPGQSGPQLRTYRQVCQPKSPSLAQPPKVPDGRVSLPNLTHASSTSSMLSCTSSASEPSNASFRHLLQRRNPIIPDTVKLPPGILSQSAASGSAQTFASSGNHPFKFLVRRREQPGRRKDSTQSLYIDNPESDLLLQFSSCLPSASSSSSSIAMIRSPQPQHHNTKGSKGPRRFSDPDIPYMEEDVWPGQNRKDREV